MDSERVLRVNDTTLRDGEQAPGVAFTPRQKAHLASLLDEAGVGGIEAGTPACGEEERLALKMISRLGLKAEVSAWCRAMPGDIASAADCGIGSVAIAISVSDTHLDHKFRRSVQWAWNTLEESIVFARKLGLSVCAAMEDASRTDQGRLLTFARLARDAGADRIRLSDTVGVLDPAAAGTLVRSVLGQVDLPLEFHAHNDLGMATANALAAVQAGAHSISVTVLGLGERAGNASLEQACLAVEKCLGRSTGVDPRKLPALCKAVSCLAGRPIPPDKPVVGSCVFAHESGIHVDGVLKNPATYEPFAPELVGQKRRVVLGKHSGRRSVAHVFDKAGFTVSEGELELLTAKAKSGGLGGCGDGHRRLVRQALTGLRTRKAGGSL